MQDPTPDDDRLADATDAETTPPRPARPDIPLEVHIPQELKELNQFVLWEYALPEGRNNWTKKPRTVRGGAASSTDPATWATFDQAMDAYRRGNFDGIGSVFAADDPYCGIDLDNALNADGTPKAWAKAILDDLSSYTEVSPSGLGVKIWVRAKLPGKGRRVTHEDGEIEIYDRGRYFTVTGRRVPNTPIEVCDAQEAVDRLLDKLGLMPKPAAAAKIPAPIPDFTQSDAELINRAKSAKNGAKFSALWGGSTAGHGGDDSRADLALCDLLAFWTGGDTSRIDQLFRSSGLYRPKWDERRGEKTYGQMTIDKSMEGRTEFFNPSINAHHADTSSNEIHVLNEPHPNGLTAPQTKPEKARIFITTDEPGIVEQVVSALAADPELYHRGGALIHVMEDEEKETKKRLRSSGSPKIREMPPSIIRSHIVDHCILFKRDSKGNLYSVHPPDWLTPQVADRGQWKGLRRLEAISESPLLRPDGSILQTKGYDPETQILYLPNAVYLPVKPTPTKDDAVAAVGELMEVICDVPFATKTHLASWLASLLTPLARHAFDGPAPLFLMDANVRAAGKGLTLSAVTMIATGRRFAVSTYSHNAIEMEKVITSIAMAGEPLVLLDNVAGALGNGPLDAALTATEWRGRLLGGNKMPTYPLYCIWYATGNNVVLEGDTARRTCHIRIESKEANPENRDIFRHPDLLRWVNAERPRLLRAALTILAAYCAAGRPNQNLKPWGSFEAWSDLVRSAIVWAGQSDPGDARAGLIASSDTGNNSLAILLKVWVQICPIGSAMTAATFLDRIDSGLKSGHEPSVEIANALKTILPGKHGNQLPTSRELGTVLRGFRGRRGSSGEWFDFEKEDRNGVALWHILREGSVSSNEIPP